MQTVEEKSAAETLGNFQKRPDVLLMVVDSVASAQAIRSLPRTVNLLKHGMMAVEFRKLNKVGANSKPNAFPLLFGKILEHVDKKAFNVSSIPADWSYDYFCNSYLDNASFIPFEYRDAGYKVLSAEDYGLSVLYWPECYGMKENKFHHSYRPFYTRLEEDPDLYNIHTKGSCRLQHNNMLDYLSLFLKANEGSPKFSLVWFGELAHDDAADLYAGDYDLYDFFLKHKEALENSFTFVLGDHGSRFGSEAKASASSDANNPFLYIVLPKIHRLSKLHEQLLKNSQEIVTHHDLHSTLKDILYFQPESMFTDLEYKRFDSDPHGSSLLREFEPGVVRTCKTLPIPFQYCICQYKKEIFREHEKVVALGKFAAAGIASILESYNVSSQCEKIAMYKVFKVEKYIGQNTSTSNESYFDIIFSVAEPAEGQFKIPIREDEHGNLELAGDQFQRLIPYGHNGDCMRNYLLQPLCTCKNRTTVLPATTSPTKSLPTRKNGTAILSRSTPLLRSSSTRTKPFTVLHKSTSREWSSSSPLSKST
ncbi:hypothetical protein GCK32_003377 [Trichostrongylus colubriformis]|uniref:Uncharacterized protein n=1 Tax=Trichostrongylus colubriformis TaxID=6319 RepID=A0AAN8EP08_TRICO